MVLQNNNNNDINNMNDLNDDRQPLRNEGGPQLEDGVDVALQEDVNHNVILNPIHPSSNRNLIQDLDGWLESNGLRSMDDVVSDDRMSDQNHSDECRRIHDEERYAKSIHEQAFHDDILQEEKERKKKKNILHSLQDKTMDIRTRHDEVIHHIPLHRMANACDTILTMVQNKSLWDDKYTKHHRQSDDPSSESSPTCFIQLSLESYSKPTVQEFVNLCLSYHSDNDDDDEGENDDADVLKTSDEYTDKTNKRHCLDSKSRNTGTTTSKTISKSSSSSVRQVLDQITDDAIILDCCRIGHYLLAQPIVDIIIHDVLIPSIDTKNCFTLYTLADELNLSSSTLLQRTLSHMIQTIGEYSAKDDDDDNQRSDELNNDMYSKELKERLCTMKRALESSVHGGGGSSGGPSQLYFSTIEEYLSIFAERVQYYQERLHEAKECQKQLIEQQEQCSTPFTIRGRVISSSYLDAETKIQKQEQRVRTLEIAYAEQKALFRSNSSSNGKNV